MRWISPISVVFVVMLLLAGCTSYEETRQLAIDSKDPSRCGDLQESYGGGGTVNSFADTSANEVEACYRDVAIALKNVSICKMGHDADPAGYETCLSVYAWATKDASACNLLHDAKSQNDCRQATVAMDAVERKDMDFCEQGSRPRADVDECFYYYAERTKDTKACDKIQDLAKRGQCTADLAAKQAMDTLGKMTD